MSLNNNLQKYIITGHKNNMQNLSHEINSKVTSDLGLVIQKLINGNPRFKS